VGPVQPQRVAKLRFNLDKGLVIETGLFQPERLPAGAGAHFD
jgi:hypothetical protein